MHNNIKYEHYTIIDENSTVLYFINNPRKCHSYYSKPVNEDQLNKLVH